MRPSEILHQEPMLARRADSLPVGDFLYEPKWDGVRCLARTGAIVELWSRHGKPLARYFPEVVAELGRVGRDLIVDGELVLRVGAGYDFGELLGRLQPSPARVEILARTMPATFIVFDLLCDGDDDLRCHPFAERRERLAGFFASAGPLRTSPITDDVRVASAWLERLAGRGVDGVVAKARDLAYQPGRRAMIKVKPARTVECVVGGIRLAAGPGVGSLLLGLYDGPTLRHVGVSTSFEAAERRQLLVDLRPLAARLEGHPWERCEPVAATRDWLPLRPERVCEVGYDALCEDRFRHAARFVRWRPDRVAGSCSLAQIVDRDGAT